MGSAAVAEVCQRWRERRDTYRPAGEPIDTTHYGVELVEDADARRFVIGHHYSASYVAARVAVGLFRSRAWITPELVGVAVFSVPAGPKVLNCWFGDVPAVELGRLVLLDDVPANGESWFVARAFRALRQALPAVRAVLSFSDPVQRVSADGRVVVPGHIGVIYQALNGAHLGRSTPRTLIETPDGSVLSERALSKLRTGDRGADYTYALLRRWGAPGRRLNEDGGDYVRRALADRDRFRRIRHPGNIAYGWRLDGVKLACAPYPASAPYPKGEVLVSAA